MVWSGAMSRENSRFVAYAQLMRLPNVFTAVADPLAGWWVVGGGEPAWQLGLLMGASACLYTSGIVFNDCFDYELDKRERPERPLPRGAIRRRTASMLAGGLMAGGLALAWLADQVAQGTFALGIAVFLAVMIFFYSGWAKRFAGPGALTLGACRFANFLLGMRYAPPRLWWAPATLAAYVVALSLVSRTEAVNPATRATVKRLLLGIIVVDAAVVMAATGDLAAAALVLSLLIPAAALGRVLAMT
jgi:4-hydroxybenzoate polyprenyltransferase